MTLPTFPQIMGVTVLGYLVGRGVAGVPLVTDPGLIGDGLALADAAWAPAFTVRTNFSSSIPCQVCNSGLPLMMPAAVINAA